MGGSHAQVAEVLPLDLEGHTLTGWLKCSEFIQDAQEGALLNGPGVGNSREQLKGCPALSLSLQCGKWVCGGHSRTKRGEDT